MNPRSSSPRLRSFSLSLALCAGALALSACDSEDQEVGGVVAQQFEEGVAQDTEGGAFRVVLTSRGGLEAGDESTLIARVGFHEPSDPDGPGKGVPGATVQLDAYMPNGAGYIESIEATYLNDGQYLLEGIELDQAGTWRFELGIEVGQTIDEHVAFSFNIADVEG